VLVPSIVPLIDRQRTSLEGLILFTRSRYGEDAVSIVALVDARAKKVSVRMASMNWWALYWLTSAQTQRRNKPRRVLFDLGGLAYTLPNSISSIGICFLAQALEDEY
jgi:hypothetical protein